MKINEFLEKINYNIKYGEEILDINLKNMSLVKIIFSNNSETEFVYFYLNIKTNSIYLIEYQINKEKYLYLNNIIKKFISKDFLSNKKLIKNIDVLLNKKIES